MDFGDCPIHTTHEITHNL